VRNGLSEETLEALGPPIYRGGKRFELLERGQIIQKVRDQLKVLERNAIKRVSDQKEEAMETKFLRISFKR